MVEVGKLPQEVGRGCSWLVEAELASGWLVEVVVFLLLELAGEEVEVDWRRRCWRIHRNNKDQILDNQDLELLDSNSWISVLYTVPGSWESLEDIWDPR